MKQTWLTAAVFASAIIFTSGSAFAGAAGDFRASGRNALASGSETKASTGAYKPAQLLNVHYKVRRCPPASS